MLGRGYSFLFPLLLPPNSQNMLFCPLNFKNVGRRRGPCRAFLAWRIPMSAPNMTGRTFHRTTEVIPCHPWKSKSPFVSRPVTLNATIQCPGRPVMLVIDRECSSREQKLNINFFFLKLFGHRRDIPAKSWDFPPQKFDFLGFEIYLDQKVWVWVPSLIKESAKGVFGLPRWESQNILLLDAKRGFRLLRPVWNKVWAVQETLSGQGSLPKDSTLLKHFWSRWLLWHSC